MDTDSSINASLPTIERTSDAGDHDDHNNDSPHIADEQQNTADSNDQLESLLDESVAIEYDSLKPQILESTRLSSTCVPGESDLEGDLSKVQSDFDSQCPLSSMNAGFVKSQLENETGNENTTDMMKTDSLESSVFVDSATGNGQDNNISDVSTSGAPDESVIIIQTSDSELESSLLSVEEIPRQEHSNSLLSQSASSVDNIESVEDEEDSGQESDGSGDSIEEIVQQDKSSLLDQSAVSDQSKESVETGEEAKEDESDESKVTVEEIAVVQQQELSLMEQPVNPKSEEQESNGAVLNTPTSEVLKEEDNLVGETSHNGENSDPESNHNSAPALHEEVNEQQLSSTAMQTMTQSTSSDPEVEQLTKLPETVTHIIAKNGVNVYIVGTAHFSQESQEDVAKTILMTRPRVVVVELCVSRLNILRFDEETILEEAKNLNMEKIRSTIKQYGAVQGALYLLFLSTSAHLTRQLGMAPGGEFRRAYLEARNVQGCRIHLGDRPIHVTLHRALAALSLWQKAKLVWHLLLNRGPISAEEVERCKQKDLLEEMLEEMTGEFPSLSRVFVHERDVCLAHSMQLAADDANAESVRNGTTGQEPTSVVGVVGIGHVAGLVRHFEHVSESDVKKLMVIPPRSKASRIFVGVVKLSVVGLVCYGCYKIAPKIPLPSALNWNSIRQSVLFTRGSSAVAAI